MTGEDRAVLLDEQDRPMEAARAYEEAVAASRAGLNTYLNLAALCFQCCDPGYAAHHHLPPSFLGPLRERTFSVLDGAEDRFGRHPDVEFWRTFFRFVLEEVEPDESRLEALARGSVMPYLYLFAFSGRGRPIHREGATRLRRLTEGGKTAKDRYVASVLASACRRSAFEGRRRST